MKGRGGKQSSSISVYFVQWCVLCESREWDANRKVGKRGNDAVASECVRSLQTNFGTHRVEVYEYFVFFLHLTIKTDCITGDGGEREAREARKGGREEEREGGEGEEGTWSEGWFAFFLTKNTNTFSLCALCDASPFSISITSNSSPKAMTRTKTNLTFIWSENLSWEK